MNLLISNTLRISLLWIVVAGCTKLAAQDKELKTALSYEPVQSGVEYDRPTAEQMKTCKLVKATKIGKSGFVVIDRNGQVLRMFINNGGDASVDQWSYYKDGVEVYRDIDTDFDGKVDQFRWFSTAGTRWGIDTNGDSVIDQWRSISAEEVTAEIVRSVKNRDLKAYRALVLNEKEIDQLGVSDAVAAKLKKRSQAALKDFSRMAATQRLISSKSKWVHFGGVQPALVPKGSNGSKKDVVVYENVAAMIENDGEHGQLSIGTLVKVGRVWKSIDLPKAMDDKSAVLAASVFIGPDDRFMDSGSNVTSNSTPRNSEQQKLFEQLETLEKKFDAAVRDRDKRTISKLNNSRADLLIQIASSYDEAEQKSTWIRQFADTVAGAYQSGDFPDGLSRVREYYIQLKREKAGKQDLGYLLYRMISARYSKKFEDAKQSDVADIQKKYVAELEEFVDVYPNIDQSADAMMQLAIWNEFASTTDTKDAEKWYSKIVRTFPDGVASKKARGALARLRSEGRAIRFSGPYLGGQNTYSLDSDRGNVVVIHYWQYNKDADYEGLEQIYRKYRRKGFNLINVNLDADATSARKAIRDSKLPGVHLFQKGGMESAVATQLGIAVPTIILIDKKGKVANRNIRIRDLEKSVDKLLK